MSESIDHELAEFAVLAASAAKHYSEGYTHVAWGKLQELDILLEGLLKSIWEEETSVGWEKYAPLYAAMRAERIEMAELKAKEAYEDYLREIGEEE